MLTNSLFGPSVFNELLPSLGELPSLVVHGGLLSPNLLLISSIFLTECNKLFAGIRSSIRSDYSRAVGLFKHGDCTPTSDDSLSASPWTMSSF